MMKVILVIFYTVVIITSVFRLISVLKCNSLSLLDQYILILTYPILSLMFFKSKLPSNITYGLGYIDGRIHGAIKRRFR